ncbi:MULTISPECIES: acyl-CoA synthetase [Achromobacter]|uniref:Acyl-CoA synthetase n=1 Tax=Alcaligenes xylosoxydans xylosoxydans TaxID=85698 RepID=A0A424W7J0_ALCXX|nr:MULTISPECIES: acyl-CoA synthetase [Achromobacter]MBC9907982.1 acyl-CoA synthetase [Achromobacter xylosoxidans]MBD0872538.1 acyl-CoA synthetase [Achromobacter xylosoxidans]QNP87136.1 acyl-CoA synthetase [Achromobacter xylosoxidans]RPJ89242.1 acyl-CoA synthetase [Achromobacter xylosoxidans]WLW63089.1 acyl-CoA synthetase [Achromobacter aegrifaciens]
MPADTHDHHAQDIERNSANHLALSPLTFIERAAKVYPERTAIVHGALRRSWRETYARCRRLASGLARLGVRPGDTVAVMAPNIPALYEAHFGVAMAGAVLNALNTRLDAETLSFILEHGAAAVLLTDREYAPVMAQALAKTRRRIRVVDIDDPEYGGPGEPIGEMNYEALLEMGDAAAEFAWPEDEWQSLCLNYTSGTTGSPKGVLYHHRGAYLNAMGNALACDMRQHAVYLWTLPMFHCNGWSFPWTIALLAGTNVCLRRVEAGAIFDAIQAHGVDYFCAAPVVLGMLINSPPEIKRRAIRPVQVLTGGSPPPAAVIAAMDELGIDVTHLYGLTESYGPSISCAWHEAWSDLPLDEQAALKARIGVRKHTMEQVRVLDPATMEPVPPDGVTVGEIMMRGNTLMKGYLKNPQATAEAFAGGWFHTGDLGVVHPDGYMQIKDRAKDIVISGGENISTVEVEDALYAHPAVLEAAVVARPDAKWGETPCAFVTLKEGGAATAEELASFCRGRLAGFKVPRTFVFGPLPKTATGKIQKYLLREQARQL